MKVLLATDGTKHSKAAVETIGNLKLSDGDEIKVVTVIDMAIPTGIDMYAGYVPNTVELEKAVRENAEKTVEDTSKLIAESVANEKITVVSDILIGSPESRIVECAEEYQADLVVVGSHGYNRWERLLLGSVSDSVVHHAPCSVLVVRTQSED